MGRKNFPSRAIRKRLAAERREREDELKELAGELKWEWACNTNGQHGPTQTDNQAQL